MSRYFSLFNTEAQYEAAKDTLDYPNVSLIETTGDLHYSVYHAQEVADAAFGSILMAEVSTNKLFYIDNSYYNLTDYPFADYKPIAVCIFDKASNANNQTVFLSVQWLDITKLGIGSKDPQYFTWGFNNVDLSSEVTGIRDTGTNHISSISINNAVKPLITKDYSGSSILDTYGNGESSVFCSAYRFKTTGTLEGDWYIPSYYDLTKYKNNYSTINNILTNIKNVAGSSYINNPSMNLWCASEANNTKAYVFTTGSNFTNANKNSNYSAGTRAVFIAGIEEV
jgi:hypothetical protein